MSQDQLKTEDKVSEPSASGEDWHQMTLKLWKHGQHMSSQFLKGLSERQSMGMQDPLNLSKFMSSLAGKMVQNPSILMRAQSHFFKEYSQLMAQSLERMMKGDKKNAPIRVEDKRFKEAEWHENYMFDFVKNTYFLTTKYLQTASEEMQNLDPENKNKIDFYTRQMIDALSPTNFFMTNPEVLKETLKSNGENLKKGLNNLLNDLERGGGKLKITTTDINHFEVGQTIAATPGKVVYQNSLIQLIHYEPKQQLIYEVPLLMIAPWINKYYIFDLKGKSFVEWALDQGQNVFLVSWINPDETHADKDFEDYMKEGVLDAVEAILKHTGKKQVNVLGYCIGGTVLAGALCYLENKKLDWIKSATFLTTLLDFEEAGDLGVFIDEHQIKFLEQRMEKQGFLDAGALNTTYSILRANDMIWSYVVSNYMMGKDPVPFDLLYWNADSTHMPKAMMSFFLKNMYLNNLFSKPDGVSLLGVPIDLKKIKIPCFVMASKSDHIAPWKTVYKATELLGGPVEFVLSASGHVAGVTNHPAQEKYCYWTNLENKADAEEWFENSTEHPGSWWKVWKEWLQKQGGKKEKALAPDKGNLPVIEEAPGSYVRVRRF
jgi:polyhydroxyalkanoate synthase subunit PhaC